jgi:hypothetical protein
VIDNVRGLAENEGDCHVCDLTLVVERLPPCRRDGASERWNLVEEWLGELAVPIALKLMTAMTDQVAFQTRFCASGSGQS